MIQQNILKQQQEYENRQTNQKRNPSVSNIKSKKIDHEIHKSNALSSTLQNPDDTSLKNEKNIESTPIKDSNNNEADSKNDSISQQNNVVNSEPQFSNDLSKLLNYGNPQPSNAQTKTEISKLEIQEIEINDNYSDDDDDDENNENSVEHDWQPKSQVHTSRMKKVLSQRDSIVFENISFNDIQELNVQPSHSTPIIGHGSNKWSRRYGHYGSGTMSSDHFNFSSHSSMSSCELDREVLSVEPDSDFTLILPFDSFKLSRMQDNSVLSQVPSEIDISQYKTVDLLNDYCGST
ncbi:hypothetical protein TRFO_33648 [Tritrichomonas foetus]|uniref:Uncharacterized protein n=1 Tax=Tritrichomonas foetus TaxID=1144522 RepID=A0A1J4JRD3_9EUKA|nr:hypothetical protein TRFO_33648 [Tritrichomonas foetus]|eukprot:OHS99820.1 hypothetical protein TRFO_33648 [Tritrichomonas foetus]